MTHDLIPHPPPGFWQFKLAHLLTIVTMLGGIIMFTMRFENRVSKIENAQQGLLLEQSRLSAIMERMDAQGTYASQRGIQRDTEAVMSNTRRIESLESAVREVAPKVERLNANMDWLIKSLQDGGAIKHDEKGGHP